MGISEFDRAIQIVTTALSDSERLIEWTEGKVNSSLDYNQADILLEDLERYRRMRDDCKSNLKQLYHFKSLLNDNI